MGSAFTADAGGFGAVWGLDSPVAVRAFELAGSEFLFFGFLFFDLGLRVGVFTARAGFLGGHLVGA